MILLVFSLVLLASKKLKAGRRKPDMAITKQKKEEIVNEIQQAVASAQSAVFTQFHGLTVGEVNQLRSAMNEAGVSYRVAKKTLLKRVLDASLIKGSYPELEGEVSIAWADDLIAPAREAQKFHKDHTDNFSIVGGIFEGRFMDRDEMVEIATIPDETVLRGMFVNVINSPIQGFVVALNAITEKKEV
jgi:large subunit ribosomal protein L10